MPQRDWLKHGPTPSTHPLNSDTLSFQPPQSLTAGQLSTVVPFPISSPDGSRGPRLACTKRRATRHHDTPEYRTAGPLSS
ncbi:hypothetical protein PR202_ga16589 [Eleusine coracana subsp. coracana]|uniref:Uncharacterized protein n=1 Tax=Eleusine coracana subsp. coracana TaxID=191504 RepID=A0AAV5CLW5_ELECO|nr:hypothetical protein PR202_ga16589 [Eleusine coracana subsp. coracana]